PCPGLQALEAFCHAVGRGGDAEADVALAVPAIAAPGRDDHGTVVDQAGGVVGTLDARRELRPDVEAGLRRVHFEADLPQRGDHPVAAALVDGVVLFDALLRPVYGLDRHALDGL